MHAFTTLAMGFLNPFLLWGLLFAGIPLLIQWLHRRKYTERVWAAMRFLKRATESQTRRLRMESLLLLCVRTAVLLLAALAVAQPILESSGLLPSGETATHTLIVLDMSLSMQARVDGITVAERARQAVRSIVEDGSTGDSYQLVTVAAKPEVVIRQPSFSPDDVLTEIDRLVLKDSFGDVPAALIEAAELIEHFQTSGRQRTVIASDFQRTNWEFDDSGIREHTQQALDRIAARSEIILIPLETQDVSNVSVLDAEVETPFTTISTPITIMAHVRNHGREALPGHRVQLVENDRILATENVDLPSSGEVSVPFVTQWSEAGSHALEIRTGQDALLPDNHHWLTVNVKHELSVLLVNGRPATEPLSGASDFVEVALRPSLTSETDALTRLRTSWDIAPTVINEAALINTNLADYDCVFLCNVPFLSDDEVKRLEGFVRAGGGLVIGLGEQVLLDQYSRQLSQNGDGLMPVQLTQVTETPDEESEPFHFAEPVIDHLITRPFIGNPQSGLTTANVYRFVETRMASDSGARIILSYAQGSPAIIEHAYGSGRVLLITTSLDDRWGSWALWPSFLPMMHQTVEYAVAGASSRTAIVGHPITLEFPNRDDLPQTLTLTAPDGRIRQVRTVTEQDSISMTIDDLEQCGAYSLEVTPTDMEHLVVNVDPRESDLRQYRESDLSSSVLGSVGFRMLGAVGGDESTAIVARSTSGIWRWLLVVVLTLLLVEQVMAWNARYGLMALVSSPFLITTLMWRPTVFASMLLLAAIGFSVWSWRIRST
ncbi:MAG: BatA domain-containing protein [Planctomycetaceae bacterium]|nr:BatA domain-containing protein [Planctomycetaceae bacterium]